MPKIFIDAGHGGKDPGAVNGDIYEKDIALQIALKLNNAPSMGTYTRKILRCK